MMRSAVRQYQSAVRQEVLSIRWCGLNAAAGASLATSRMIAAVARATTRAESFFVRHVEIARDRQFGAYRREPGAAQSLVQSRQLDLKLIPRLEQWQGFFPHRLTGVELGGGRCCICPYDFLVESLNVTLNLTQGCD